MQVDLVGGYYDAGDHVKFGLPMAFTVTMLSWSVIEYGEQIAAAGEYGHALEAIKWGTDYFIKAHTHPNVLWAEVVPLSTSILIPTHLNKERALKLVTFFFLFFCWFLSGGGRRYGSLLLAKAGGHDDVQTGLQDRRGEPGVGSCRRDGGCDGGSFNGVPELEPPLLSPPVASRPTGSA